MAANEVLAGRFNAVLAKLLSMKERAPAGTLAPDVFPSLTLESDRPEWEFLGGGKLGHGFGITNGAVNGQIALANPAGSGVLVVVTRIETNVAAASLHVLGEFLGTTTLPLSFSMARDTRLVSTNLLLGLAAEIRFGNSASDAPGSTDAEVFAAVAPPRTGLLYTEPVVLKPGSGVFCRVSAAQLLTVNYTWRERALEPSELR